MHQIIFNIEVTKDVGMVVNFEYIQFLKDELKIINGPDFNDLEIHKDGKLVVFTDDMKETAKYIGLNNNHLIEIFVEELENIE